MSASTSVLTSAPTLIPASIPTRAPALMRTVIVASTLPVVSSLSTASVSSTQMTLTAILVGVQMTLNSFPGGSLYCIALGYGSAPSTIGGIKSAATDGSSSVGAMATIPIKSTYPLKLNVAFTGLLALQSYAVYCYVESSTGVGSSLTNVLSTKVVVSTPCCKVFKYSNSPSSLYGNYSKYSESDPSLYVFTYTLSAPPSEVIKVTPLLYLNGILTTDVKAIPLSVNYNSMSLLTRSFILSANALINGSYAILLSVTGMSAAEYFNTTSTVRILSSVSVLPPPVMISSRFSDSGQAVVITFNTLTNSAGIVNATWPCSRLFSFIRASLTTCSWTTAATVTMTFSSSLNNANLIPGNSVNLTGGLLRVICSGDTTQCAKNAATNQSSLPTSAPVNPISPVVVLNSPLSLCSCDNLTLDASASYGNGGRPYTAVQWIVSAVAGSASTASIDAAYIMTYLNDYSSRYQVTTPITILAQNLTKASYTITLSLTNFLRLTSFSTVTVTVKTDKNIPLLSIIGPSYRTVVASSPLTILSAVTISKCVQPVDTVNFTWTIKNGNANTNINSLSSDPSIFAIPSYKLVVNNIYTITVTASTSTSTVNVSTIVYVAHGVVTAFIVGGTYRSAPVNSVLQLNASGSYDSDYPQTSVSMLSYQVQYC